MWTPLDRADVEPASVLHDEYSVAFAQRTDYFRGQAQHGGLVGRAVADDERAATLRDRVEHATKCAPEQKRLPIDEVGIHAPDRDDVGSLPCGLGRRSPTVLHRGAEPSD